MAKIFSRATVSGATLSGASLKTALTTLWDALQTIGVTDSSRTTVTATGSLTVAQCGGVNVDATSGSIVLTLPASGTSTDEAVFNFRRIDSSANTVTVQRAGADTIEGATSFTIPAKGCTDIQLPAGSTTWRIASLSGSTAAGVRSNIGLGTTDTPTFAGLNGGSLGMLRNRVINGDMRIDQRKEGASLTLTAGAALAYCVDRFYAYCTGANATVQRVAGTGSRQYHLQFTGAASVTGLGLGHRIEGVNVNDLNNTTATLSVVLANSLLTTVNWAAYYSNASDAFGTLAVPTRTSIASGSFTVTSTMTKYSTNLSIPAGAAGRGIEIVFSVGAQTSGTWTIGDVMLEAGSVATPFPVRPLSVELAMCERYYEKSFPQGTAPATSLGIDAPTGAFTFMAPNAGAGNERSNAHVFRAKKRATPTMTGFNPSAANAQVRDTIVPGDCSATAFIPWDGGFRVTCTGNAGTTGWGVLQIGWTAEAEL